MSSIVVTGASGDLGRQIALAHAAKGTTLCLFGRDQARLQTTAALCEAKGAATVIHTVDVTQTEQMACLLRAFDANHPIGRLYVNAGISGSVDQEGRCEPLEQVVAILAVNATAAIATATPVVERMRARKSGQVVFIASLAALYGFPNTPAYSASKAALLTYGAALRRLVYVDRVGVSVACPGFVETDMSRRIKGSKPMMVSAEEAAKRIVRGADLNKSMIVFPMLLRIGIAALSCLPDVLARPFLRAFHYEVER